MGLRRYLFTAGSRTSLLAPPRCSDQNEHNTDDSSEDQDAQSDFHPDPEVTDCRLDPVPPRIWEHAATLFDQRVDRSLPPSEVLGVVEPEVPVSSEHDQCGPESEELDSHPGPDSSDVFHFFPLCSAKKLGIAVVTALLTWPLAAQAQGIFGGMERGAAEGNRVAGPVGGIVGGAVDSTKCFQNPSAARLCGEKTASKWSAPTMTGRAPAHRFLAAMA
jgi:hypothetical protein